MRRAAAERVDGHGRAVRTRIDAGAVDVLAGLDAAGRRAAARARRIGTRSAPARAPLAAGASRAAAWLHAASTARARRRWSRELRQKPRRRRGSIAVAIGDFATTRVERVPFAARLSVVREHDRRTSTTQEAQAACFENVAAHLEPGGLLRRSRSALLDRSFVALGGLRPRRHPRPASRRVRRGDPAARVDAPASRLVDGATGERTSVPFRSVSTRRARPDGAARRRCGYAIALGAAAARASRSRPTSTRHVSRLGARDDALELP